MKDQTTKLLPCPFCGSADVKMVPITTHGWDCTSIICESCGTSTQRNVKYEDEAVMRWNRARPIPLPATSPNLAEQVGGDHYKGCKIQPVQFIHANKLGFLEGCVIKRLVRHGSKNKAEDIRKAIHELRLILELEYGEKE
jgi:Lar family restriction alleviation protein